MTLRERIQEHLPEREVVSAETTRSISHGEPGRKFVVYVMAIGRKFVGESWFAAKTSLTKEDMIELVAKRLRGDLRYIEEHGGLE